MKTKLLLLLSVVLMVSSCRTISEKDTFVEQHRITEMMQKMDSVIHKQQVVQQDTSWHETFIRELRQVKERNDTSRYVVVDSTGKVIKETTVIYRERESSSERDRQEREGMIHRLESMDSTLVVMQSQLERSDSLLQVSQKEKVTEKSVPWYQQLWNSIRYMLVGMAIGIILLVILLLTTKKYWKKFIQK